MKDKNGFEIQVGDLLRHVGGGDVRADVFEPGGTVTDGPLWFEFQHGMRGAGACRTEEFWTIVKRADGSVPTKGANMSEATRPVDKYQREVREGDLLRNMDTGSIYRIIDGDRLQWHNDSCDGAMDHMRRHGRAHEIVARGLPTDPVPASFEPERDGEGRPVLGTFYPSDNEGGGQFVAERETPATHYVCAGCERSLPDACRDRYCKTCLPDEEPAPIPTPQQRYAAFRATVERVVGEEAPRARVVTDIGTVKHIEGLAFIAWIDILDKPFAVDASMSDAQGEYAYGFLRGEVRIALQGIGARAMGRAK